VASLVQAKARLHSAQRQQHHVHDAAERPISQQNVAFAKLSMQPDHARGFVTVQRAGDQAREASAAQIQ